MGSRAHRTRCPRSASKALHIRFAIERDPRSTSKEKRYFDAALGDAASFANQLKKQLANDARVSAGKDAEKALNALYCAWSATWRSPPPGSPAQQPGEGGGVQPPSAAARSSQVGGRDSGGDDPVEGDGDDDEFEGDLEFNEILAELAEAADQIEDGEQEG
mmetsp:Transcript_38918/g.96213  ORF Transcript_38918/g.96213 Transcript_38918/m.96213 type:complete len:161 (+) Transcript_38918:232-714(+)